MSSRTRASSMTQPLVHASGQPSQQRTGNHTSYRPLQGYDSLYSPGHQHDVSIHERATEIAPRLHPAECRVLMDAVAPLLFGTRGDYTPPHGEPEQIAQTLTNHYGLLAPERLGYASGYRPTLLGVAVIWRCLLT